MTSSTGASRACATATTDSVHAATHFGSHCESRRWPSQKNRPSGGRGTGGATITTAAPVDESRSAASPSTCSRWALPSAERNDASSTPLRSTTGLKYITTTSGFTWSTAALQSVRQSGHSSLPSEQPSTVRSQMRTPGSCREASPLEKPRPVESPTTRTSIWLSQAAADGSARLVTVFGSNGPLVDGAAPSVGAAAAVGMQIVVVVVLEVGPPLVEPRAAAAPGSDTFCRPAATSPVGVLEGRATNSEPAISRASTAVPWARRTGRQRRRISGVSTRWCRAAAPSRVTGTTTAATTHAGRPGPMATMRGQWIR